jgi:hypothetical protein
VNSFSRIDFTRSSGVPITEAAPSDLLYWFADGARIPDTPAGRRASLEQQAVHRPGIEVEVHAVPVVRHIPVIFRDLLDREIEILVASGGDFIFAGFFFRFCGHSGFF